MEQRSENARNPSGCSLGIRDLASSRARSFLSVGKTWHPRDDEHLQSRENADAKSAHEPSWFAVLCFLLTSGVRNLPADDEQSSKPTIEGTFVRSSSTLARRDSAVSAIDEGERDVTRSTRNSSSSVRRTTSIPEMVGSLSESKFEDLHHPFLIGCPSAAVETSVPRSCHASDASDAFVLRSNSRTRWDGSEAPDGSFSSLTFLEIGETGLWEE